MFSKLESLYIMIKKLVIIVVTPPQPGNGNIPLTEHLLKP
jgi:hypothetical protein